MPFPTFATLRADVRLRLFYRCRACGVVAPGDTITVTTTSLDAPDVQQVVMASAHNSHMPVGWAGYGRAEHACPNCQ